MKDFTANYLSGPHDAATFATKLSNDLYFSGGHHLVNHFIVSQGIIEPQKNNPGTTHRNKNNGHQIDHNSSCFYNKNTHRTRCNDAFTNLVMAGTYSLATIHYPNALISSGPLQGAENASAAITRDGDILFKWSDNSGIKTAKTNDKVMLVTYFPSTKQIVYTLHAATRAGCEALLPFNKYRGKTAETWIGFVSHDGRDAGDSAYAGRVQL